MHEHEPDPEHPTKGLAPERTELAWDRSGLAVVVCAAVLLRRVWPLDTPGRVLAAAAIGVGIALWTTVLLVANHRARHAPEVATTELPRMLVATLAFATGAFTLSLFPPN